MSTQDDALLTAFDEPEPDNEQASDEVDAESSNEEEVVAESEETEESAEETETTQQDDSETERTLSESSRTIVENFEGLSEEERTEKLDKLETSGRSDQIEAAKAIREVYGLAEPEAPVIDDDVIAQAVERKLQEMGVNPQDLEKVKAQATQSERNDIIKSWANGNEADPDKIMSDKEFLKQFHGEELRDLPLAQRTKMALYETYGNSKNFIKASKRQALTISANTPPTGDKVVETETDNLFEMAAKANQPLR